MAENGGAELTRVEQAALDASGNRARYTPTEKVSALVVTDFPALGKLAALRFLEWVQEHPDGVVSLPTGKTPEHFIRWVVRLLEEWDRPATRSVLEAAGLDPARRPDLRGLRFVQMDEFYPAAPEHENSFFHYVNRYYLGAFGLDAGKALLMDCSRIGLVDGQSLERVWPDKSVDLSLRCRRARSEQEQIQKDVLTRIDQWCQDYEASIRGLGGIGFFLGGIGPDGHVAFNVRGSDHHSTTRLTHTNYETQAAAATDLGGIDVARRRPVITIGLGTITYNPDATAIILAAGAAKAGVVADAIQQPPHVRYPATALQRLSGARFYLTAGAAEGLRERRLWALARVDRVSDEVVARALIDLAVAKGKRLLDLGEADFASDRVAGAVLTKRPESRAELLQRVRDRVAATIDAGSQCLSGARFLHTEPHHDDVMLGELPYVVRHTRDASNVSYFATLTSGFTSVTHGLMRDQLLHAAAFIGSAEFGELRREHYFDPDNAMGRQRDVWQYLDGVAGREAHRQHEGIARRMTRNLVALFGDLPLPELKGRLAELADQLEREYTGGRDPEEVRRLKGMLREWEAECLWGYFGWDCPHVRHLRLGFYTGETFSPAPTIERDVQPVRDLLAEVRPTVVTLALDPEASGPDTHYKCLQILAAAIEQYVTEIDRSDIRIIGYRNVWHRFHLAEANISVPVSLNMFGIMESAFTHAFVSQRDASFPSHEHEGLFNELAQKIQVEHYQNAKTCLGRDWFYEHARPLIRATRGLVLLKELSLGELTALSRELRQATEGR